MRLLLILLLLWIPFSTPLTAQEAPEADEPPVSGPFVRKSFFGKASYYADKFEGRQTSSGELYQPSKFTAACNVLPLGTWIRVINTSNQKTVIVRINDRLHPKNKRLLDLSKVAAVQLGYVRSGLAQVQVVVLGKMKPREASGEGK